MKATRKLFAAVLLLINAASALAEVHYVDVNSTNATPPYINWTTAATNIQDAVDAAMAGDEIVVTDGIYGPVNVDKPLSVGSVNGAGSTTIDAKYRPHCASLTNGASLTGFTLTHGYAEIGPPMSVGGAGARGGTLNYCTLTENVVFTISPRGSRLCFGGGAAFCTLNNCTLTDNYASASNGSLYPPLFAEGGGAYSCTLNNCTLTGNSTMGNQVGTGLGGGAAFYTLNNCTLTGNFADDGGGASDSTLNNCIVYYNMDRAEVVNNFDSYSLLNYSCTTPLPTNGFGNITNAPLFADQPSGDLRLQSDSPCINGGLNAFAPAGPDLDGNPRIVGGTVDMGAYEFQSLDLLNFDVVSNQFGFNVTGQSNWVIVLEASSDFTNWTPLRTNTLSGSPFPFRDPAPPNLPQRFYRARLQ